MNRREKRRWVKKQAEISKKAGEKLKAQAVDKIVATFERMEDPYRTEVYDRIRAAYEGEEV